MADWQRGVFVGTRGQCFIDEQMARHHADRIEGGFVGDAGIAQAIHQAIADPLRGHADADGFGLQAKTRGHAGRPSASVSPATQLATFSNAW
ncbi:hypothetical protein D3C71_1760030 [compost metagenome]